MQSREEPQPVVPLPFLRKKGKPVSFILGPHRLRNALPILTSLAKIIPGTARARLSSVVPTTFPIQEVSENRSSQYITKGQCKPEHPYKSSAPPLGYFLPGTRVSGHPCEEGRRCTPLPSHTKKISHIVLLLEN